MTLILCCCWSTNCLTMANSSENGGLWVVQNLLAHCQVTRVCEGGGIVPGDGHRGQRARKSLLWVLLGEAKHLGDQLVLFIPFFFLIPKRWVYCSRISFSRGLQWPRGGEGFQANLWTDELGTKAETRALG